MPEPQAAALELRHRTIAGAGRIVLRGVFERRVGAQHLEHLFRVVLPVGCAMQVCAGFEMRRELRDERRLDQPALVMARLVPRVREEDVHAVEAVGRDHLREHLDRVVLNDPDVRQLLLADQLQQRADARLVHLDADEVVAGAQRGDFRRRRTHPEADFQHARRAAAEDGVPVRLRAAVRYDEVRAELVDCAALAGGYAAGARDEAADAAQMERVRVVVAGGRRGAGCRGGGGGGVVVVRRAGGVRVVVVDHRDNEGEGRAAGAVRDGVAFAAFETGRPYCV